MKKCLSVLLICLLLALSAGSVLANEKDYSEEDVYDESISLINHDSYNSLDMMLIAYRLMASEPAMSKTTDRSILDRTEPSMWDRITGVKNYQPLYDGNGNIIAHYISFEPTGYIIINNNKYNPVALEFSSDDSFYEELLTTIPRNELLPYSFTLEEVDLNAYSEEEEQVYHESLDVLTQSLSSADHETYNEHKKLKTEFYLLAQKSHRINKEELDSLIESQVIEVSQLRNAWGIIWSHELPSGSFSDANLPGIGSINNWGTTGQFSNPPHVTRHCGTTAAFNVVYYYSIRYNRPWLMFINRQRTFEDLHSMIDNGPVAPWKIRTSLNSYVQGRPGGSTFSGAIFFETFNNIKSRIDQGRMCILLLNGWSSGMHYVNAIGYRHYTTGHRYHRIIDNHNNSIHRYVLHSRVFAAQQAHIQ